MKVKRLIYKTKQKYNQISIFKKIDEERKTVMQMLEGYMHTGRYLNTRVWVIKAMKTGL